MRKFAVKLARGAVKVIGRLPLKVHYFFAGVITWILRDVMRYRNDTGISSLYTTISISILANCLLKQSGSVPQITSVCTRAGL